jgi:processing peptidase subunit alpha
MRRANISLLRHGRVPARLRAFRSYSTEATESTVKVTTLPNKIRVATEATPGHFSSVGLYIDGGSRYEWPEVAGVSHFLDRMAFKVRL